MPIERFSRLTLGTNLTGTDQGDGEILIDASGGSATFVGCRVKLSSAGSLLNNSVTVIGWTAEDYDTDVFHDNSTNNSRITIPTGLGGKYLVSVMVGNFYRAGSAAGRRFITLKKNGSNYQRKEVPPLSETWIDLSVVDAFAAADYLEVDAFQTSGGDGAELSAVAATAGGVCYFAATRLGA